MSLPRRLLPYGAASLVLLVFSTVLSAHADTRSQIEAARHRQERMERLTRKTQRGVVRLRDEMNVLAARIEEATSEFEHAMEEIVAVRDDIRVERAELRRLQHALNQRAATIFMDGIPSEVQVLLDAESVNDMFDRFTYVEAASERDQVIAERVEAQEAELAAVETELQVVLLERRRALEELQSSRAKLERKFRVQKRRITRLDRLHEEAGDTLDVLYVEIRDELLALGGDGVYGPLVVCPVGDPHAYGDTFGILHVHPGWKHIHKGNDLAAPLGTPVYAPFDGVVETGTEKYAGKFVKLWGEEGFVTMLHLSRWEEPAAPESDEVEAGDVVGYVGITGNASSPHVHFEWHPDDGSAVDPYPQLNEVC
jgi:murein DD-endopeptidase MepM/ murein hydrolase activator NlpD